MAKKFKMKTTYDKTKIFNRSRGGNSYHPLREAIVREIDEAERPMSPNELAQVFDEGLSQVSYHVTVLKDHKALRLKKTIPRRGAVEHYYEITEGVLILNEEATALDEISALMPSKRQRTGVLKQISQILENTGRSLGSTA